MKARINGIDVEGTLDEIASLLRQFGSAVASNGPAVAGADVPSGRQSSMDEDFAFRVLKRRPLSREQTLVLSLLRRNHPSWTTAFDLQKATKYNPNQLAGLLGAFGKRVAATEGHQKGQYFFEVVWDYDLDCYTYRLVEAARSAVIRAGL